MRSSRLDLPIWPYVIEPTLPNLQAVYLPPGAPIIGTTTAGSVPNYVLANSHKHGLWRSTALTGSNQGDLVSVLTQRFPRIAATNEFVEIEDSGTSGFFNPTAFTAMVWVWPEDAAQPRYSIFGRDTAFFNGWGLYIEGSSGFRFYGNAWNVVVQTSAPQYNRWQHVAVRHDGFSSASAAIFLNGVKTSGTLSRTSSFSADFLFGALAQFGGSSFDQRTFKGNLAGFEFYDRSLTDDEVFSRYAPESRWAIYRKPSRRLVFVVAGGGFNQTITPPVAGADAVAVSSLLVPGGVSITLTVAAAIASAIVPELAGLYSISAPVATATASAIPTSVLPGAVTVTLPIATATAAAIVPIASGSGAITPPVAIAAAEAVAPTILAGSVTLLIPVVTGTATATPPAIAGSGTIIPPEVIAAAIAVSPALLPGPATITLPTAIAEASAIVPLISGSGVTQLPVADSVALAASPSVLGGPAAFSLPTANADAIALAPFAGIPGPQTLLIPVIAAIATAALPSIVMDSPAGVLERTFRVRNRNRTMHVRNRHRTIHVRRRGL